MLQNIEFYTAPNGDIVIVREGEPLHVYVQSDKDFTDAMLETINEFYPEAFTALSKAYVKSVMNKPYHEFLMVSRFVRCNFGVYDTLPDVDANGIFRFESVPCPQRCECPFSGIICNPTFQSNLSDREFQTMKLFYEAKSLEDIADELFISVLTVKRHKQNAFLRLKVHSTAEFMAYANKNRIFQSK